MSIWTLLALLAFSATTAFLLGRYQLRRWMIECIARSLETAFEQIQIQEKSMESAASVHSWTRHLVYGHEFVWNFCGGHLASKRLQHLLSKWKNSSAFSPFLHYRCDLWGTCKPIKIRTPF